MLTATQKASLNECDQDVRSMILDTVARRDPQNPVEKPTEFYHEDALPRNPSWPKRKNIVRPRA